MDPAWFNLKTLDRLGSALQENKAKMIAKTQEEGTNRIWLTVKERTKEIDQMSALVEQMKTCLTRETERIEDARGDALKERVASLEATIKRDMGGDYLSLQALYINQLGVVRGHEQDRAKIQAALGNGANEDLWQPGTSWVDAAIRAIQHYENHLQC